VEDGHLGSPIKLSDEVSVRLQGLVLEQFDVAKPGGVVVHCVWRGGRPRPGSAHSLTRPSPPSTPEPRGNLGAAPMAWIQAPARRLACWLLCDFRRTRLGWAGLSGVWKREE